jgi:hypothetical protein
MSPKCISIPVSSMILVVVHGRQEDSSSEWIKSKASRHF